LKWLAVINPRSGDRKSHEQICDLSRALEVALPGQVEVFVSERIGQILAVARLRRDVDGFIGVGGDGTLFDLINGMSLGSQRLALVPAGTGNGVARDLGIADESDALEVLRRGIERPIDLIRVEASWPDGGRHVWRMLSTASLGYTSAVVETANVSLKPFGSFCYPIASVVRALIPPRLNGRWRRDGADWQVLSATNIVVNNTKHAGNFEGFPRARCDDGEFDCLIAKAGFAKQLLHNVSMLSRRHFYRPGPAFRARRVDIELDGDDLLMLDGEVTPGVQKISFVVEPGILRMVC